MAYLLRVRKIAITRSILSFRSQRCFTKYSFQWKDKYSGYLPWRSLSFSSCLMITFPALLKPSKGTHNLKGPSIMELVIRHNYIQWISSKKVTIVTAQNVFIKEAGCPHFRDSFVNVIIGTCPYFIYLCFYFISVPFLEGVSVHYKYLYSFKLILLLSYCSSCWFKVYKASCLPF